MKLQSKLLLVSALVLGLAAGARAATEAFVIDPVHSSIGFKIRHVVSHVPGKFTDFKGTIQVDQANLENSSVEATINVASVSTGNEKRDGHLKTPDFFDVAQYASASFKSTSWKKTGDNTYDVTGDFTLHGVTKPLTLQVTVLGFAPGMKPGTTTSGWEIAGKLNKSDYGVNGPAMLGKALGDEVELSIQVEANYVPAPAAK